MNSVQKSGKPEMSSKAPEKEFLLEFSLCFASFKKEYIEKELPNLEQLFFYGLILFQMVDMEAFIDKGAILLEQLI